MSKPYILPDWLVKQYECRAKSERAAGGSVDIDNVLPTVAVTLSGGADYFFQEHEATELLEQVPDNVAPEDYILAQAQDW